MTVNNTGYTQPVAWNQPPPGYSQPVVAPPPGQGLYMGMPNQGYIPSHIPNPTVNYQPVTNDPEALSSGVGRINVQPATAQIQLEATNYPQYSLNIEGLADQVAEKVVKAQAETSRPNPQKLASTMFVSNIGEPWQELKTQDEQGGDVDTLYAEYILPNFRSASSMQESCNYMFRCKDHEPIKVSISRQLNSSEHKLEVQMTTFSESGVSRKDILLANYINYIYHDQILRNEKEDSYYDYWFSTPPSARKETLRDPSKESNSYLIPLNGIEFYSSSNEEDYGEFKFKVPVARLGSWPHPVYKQVVFDQEDFDQIQENFKDNVLGFEPPLFLGHPSDSTTQEGAPAEAFLLELVQEDNVLFGIYEVTDEETYVDVKKGKFRYASAEIIRDHVSKRDGKNVGTVLFGHALTNRPFIPDLPRVEAFSEGAARQPSRIFVPMSLSSPIYKEIKMSNTTPTSAAEGTGNIQPTEQPAASNQNLSESPAVPNVAPTNSTSVVAPVTETVDPTPSVSNTPAQNFSDSESRMMQLLSEMKASYDQKLAVLEQANQESQQRLRDQVVGDRVSTIQNLPISNDLKEQYCNLIRSGQMGEGEQAFIESLSQMANQFSGSITTQQGVGTNTDRENLASGDSEAVEDPYAAIIARNKELATKS